MSTGQRLAGLLLAGTALAASAAQAAPVRQTIAAEYVATDIRQLAGQLADVARLCWVGKDPAFDGIRFDRVEQGAEPTTFRLVFTDQRKAAVAGKRHLRILTGKSGSLVMVVLEQENIDVSAAVTRHAGALIKRRFSPC
ncbi:hypothetical protein [Bosea sp. (in: a-proteobacteria)]|uniref:hypothetical protein n=1 Tax=Bosea sp. (in: a-proteobacteria) TaxID=1871050 RepID=UPI00260887E6|nr:hypothetical protein [Bosea sp. (in: a-proteobacteria)]MCO5091444.1 hypothetical protein [Bosea sp. (in: a-proteobacteria)]